MKTDFSRLVIALVAVFWAQGLYAQTFKLISSRQITEGTRYCDPQWSPDGAQLAFAGGDFSGIYLADAKGLQSPRMLVNDLGAGYKFEWSADGEQILFRGTRFEQNLKQQYVAVVNTQNQQKQVLAANLRRIPTPSWQYSAQGKQVSYLHGDKPELSQAMPYAKAFKKSMATRPSVTYKDGAIVIWQGHKVLRVLDQPHTYNPTISPDGNYLAYTEKGRVKVVTLATGATADLGVGYHPAWSPDSQNLVYQITLDNGSVITASDLYISSRDGKRNQQLTHTADLQESSPAWSPDGKRLACYVEKSGAIYGLTIQ